MAAQPATQKPLEEETPTSPTHSATNAVELFQRRVEASGARAAIRYKEDGTWKTHTWLEWNTASREIAAGLRALGLHTGDRACILANTRYQWVWSDFGILMAGGVTVPIYQSNTPEQCEYIINDSEARVIFCEDPHQLEKLVEPAVRAKLGNVVKVVLFDDTAHLERPDKKGRITVSLDEIVPPGHKDREWLVSLDDLREQGRAWLGKNAGALEKAWEEIRPDSIITIVYTSGTTGPPKGVVLTHSNMIAECRAMDPLLGVTEDDRHLLFLPLAHIFARLMEWSGVWFGHETIFAEGIPQLIENMRETKPTFMGSVPRVYEKAYVKIQANFEEKRKKTVARKLINWALNVGRRYSQEVQEGRKPGGMLAFQMRMADKLVFSKVKATFGGELRFFISGGAPLAREIAEFFHAAGILILEGYGLTETTAASHVNRPHSFRFGTVGQPLGCVEAKIAEDGEILLRGGNIMKEYFKKPEQTAEVLDADGWFHTGDVGVIEEGGFLRITDRKKDLIVTAGGKNVAPQNIENALKSSCPYVSQVMVHGDKRKFLSALITLNEESVGEWAREQGISFSTAADLAANEKVKALIDAAVQALNEDLASYETIKKYAILPKDFSQEDGEITPTLKVKRKAITEKYRDILDGFYA